MDIALFLRKNQEISIVYVRGLLLINYFCTLTARITFYPELKVHGT